MPNYLTKSRFKLALECPTKLYYTRKKEYANQNNANEFLKALAEGGFQVGELAKMYYPGGVDLSNIRKEEESVQLTEEALKKDTCIIYEAAFRYKNLFIRADIVIKKGNIICLYEVKAASWSEGDAFLKVNKQNKTNIESGWKPYLHDVIFQKYVIGKATNLNVSAFLLLANKNSKASVEGLNQKFKISEVGGKKCIKVEVGFTANDVGTKILIEQNIDAVYDFVMADGYTIDGHEAGFENLIWKYAGEYETGTFNFKGIGDKCGKCEFKNIKNKPNLKCGFTKCHLQRFSEKQLQQPLTYELWGCGNTKLKKQIINEGHYFLHLIPDTYFETENDKNTTGMHHTERKLKQIGLSRQNEKKPFVLRDELKIEMDSWKFPYHMIDFETSRVAIPFNAGRSPYEQIAFQFSHHIIYANGTIEHKGQWISLETGKFPNFEFVRNLKNELDKDDGTIFRYSGHENTVLNDIYKQLDRSNEADKEELLQWIRSITYYKEDKIKIEGNRCMIDLLEVLKNYYIQMDMKGSNSIKFVLPAIIKSSNFLQKKYASLKYGTEIKA